MPDKRSRKRVRDNSRFQTGLSIIPSLFTIGNLFCGYFAVLSTLRGNFDNAAIAIGIGAVLDTLDGRIARLTKTSSEFGTQLDSLADVITFGVAPAMLAFHWGLGSAVTMDATIVKHVNQLGWLSTFAFVTCSALRLARFNTQTNKPDTGSKRYFVGLPTPASAGMIASVVHYFKSPVLVVGSALLWCLLILLISGLMVSTVRYSSFKELDTRRLRPRMLLLGAAMFIGLVIFYSEVVLLTLATAYLSSGLIGRLTQTVRRFLPSVSKQPEPVHGNIET